MAYRFNPKLMYRMPTHFGPAYGPRQSPDGVKFNGKISHKSTTISVSYLSNEKQLTKLLPKGFNLYGDPVVTIFASYMKEIQWLAGRGYNVLGVTINAEFLGRKDKVHGPFLTVLWENLADPIITGREELGFSKIYCDLPEIRINNNFAGMSANWLGFNFLNFEVSDLKLVKNPLENSNNDGMLHYKYIPRTGQWGTSDIEYPVISPVSNPNKKVLEYSTGKGYLKWNFARWEDMPTQYNIVNTLADLEIKKYTSATLTKSIGDNDLSMIDQRILE